MCKCNPSIRTPVCPNCSIETATPLSRLKQERSELSFKLDSLSKFVAKGKPDFLTNTEFNLMLSQETAMTIYLDILTKRLDLFQE